MTRVTYWVKDQMGVIEWGLVEQFDELRGKTWRLDEMAAEKIVQLDELSETAKILLSAVAGAVIQHLMDLGLDTKMVFESGNFRVE